MRTIAQTSSGPYHTHPISPESCAPLVTWKQPLRKRICLERVSRWRLRFLSLSPWSVNGLLWWLSMSRELIAAVRSLASLLNLSLILLTASLQVARSTENLLASSLTQPLETRLVRLSFVIAYFIACNDAPTCRNTHRKCCWCSRTCADPNCWCHRGHNCCWYFPSVLVTKTLTPIYFCSWFIKQIALFIIPYISLVGYLKSGWCSIIFIVLSQFSGGSLENL